MHQGRYGQVSPGYILAIERMDILHQGRCRQVSQKTGNPWVVLALDMLAGPRHGL